MWKAILAGAAALAITGTSLVYAQQREYGGDRSRDFDRPARHVLAPEDRAAFTDARIAALKAGLRLTPDQEKHWPAFETALRDVATLHQEHGGMRDMNRREGRRAERGELRGDFTSSEWLRQHGDMMSRMGEGLKRIADTQEPLYQSLDDSQKNRFRLLARVLTRSHGHFAEMRGPGRHHMGGYRGYGRDEGSDRGRRHRERMQAPQGSPGDTENREQL